MLNASPQLKKKFKGLSKGQAVLVITKAEKNIKLKIQILKAIADKKSGLYIIVSQPYSTLKETLIKNGVNMDQIFFIDCITKSVKANVKDDERCIYIESPHNLTDISISIMETLSAIGKEKFLFMDTVSTLLFYNSADSLIRFLHFLVSKIKILKMTGIFILVEEKMDENFLKDISQFCDKMIRL